jgi:transcriptional regulator with XRE-family HTH domain
MSVARLPVRPMFSAQLAALRAERRMSQLALSLESEVSQRHISFLEAGRSRPSKEVVLKLAGGLDLSLRATNELLTAAGLAPEPNEHAYEDPVLETGRKAFELLLTQLDPRPALVVDDGWRLKAANAGAVRLFGEVPADTDVLMLMLEGPLRGMVVNWRQAAAHILDAHLRAAVVRGDIKTAAAARALRRKHGLPPDHQTRDVGAILPLILDTPDGRLTFVTLFAALGAPKDVTLEAFRVEMFFPADASTEAWVARGSARA